MLFVTLFSVVHEWSSWSCYWALQTAIAHLIKKTSIKYRPSQVILKCKMSLDWKNILNPVMLISKWWKIICRCSSFYVHVIKRTYHRLINLLNILMLLMNVSISICFWRLTFNKKIVQIETKIEFSLKIDSFFNVLNKTLTTCLKTNYGTRSVF